MLATNKLYGLMKFKGYATRNLDEAADIHKSKYGEPKAFMVRTPYLIRGSERNKGLMVISPKYGGHAAVYIPMILDKEKLERILSELPQASQRFYIERRRQEVAITAEIVKEHERRQVLKRHCNYCGTIYNTTVTALTYHCSKSECRMKHKEYLEEMRLRKKEQLTKIKKKEMEDRKKRMKEQGESLPEFTMETQFSNSFQGWVYFIEAQNGYIKIGRSDDPSKRFIDISNMSPVPLWLRHTIFSDNYVMAEARAHRMFDKYRRHGEWFELPKEILERCLNFDHYDLDTND